MLRRVLLFALGAALPLAAALGACSAGGDHGTGTSNLGGGSGFSTGTGGTGPGSGAGPGSGGSTGALMLDAGGTGGGGPQCDHATTLVYVVSQEKALYSFDPSTLTFTMVGPLMCPGSNGAQPFSMAVDRHGFAWVLYQGGRIFHVDIKTAACTATSYQPGQHGFTRFGMGFATNGANTSDETLYLADYNGTGLASLDLNSLTVTPVGHYDQLHAAAELTGTGDGHLFGFFETPTIQIAEIDRTNAHILSKHAEPTLNIGSAWAFAFWGGSFWCFTNPNGTGSQVDQYDPMTGTTVTVVDDVGGFSIVGAGVSTCAPIKPPA
ncbi:MAG TPA: hypothetical protein VHB21_27185 [Minicystis sp.]|nr:hypothetical protein [Minicystis sp.]